MIHKNLILLSCLVIILAFVSTIRPSLNPEKLEESYEPSVKTGIFNNKIVSLPENLFTNNTPKVLGDNNSNKRIEVDLTTQELKAFENNQQIYNFKISSGKWNRTPTGEFKIWAKFRSAKMSGGSKLTGDYYYLPNVPYISFFYNAEHPKKQGFSIHGTYWHDNFGVPMSHGCINMRTSEAAIIYSWAEIENTPIVIYGKYQYPITKR